MFGDLIHVISKTSDSKYLLVGGNNGLAKINIQTNEFHTVNYLSGKNNSKFSSVVLCVYQDKDDNLWIGTEGGRSFLL
ncbi:two-component regulator propeller domain-containing protein [Algibacter lectus]|uniref:two-component regulator propeller domain-containing protein n=1 Tax=Algibacter lectus TaxID=221126 RepID=UPI0005A83837|nr:two-component regulator propeller domain-containing protein [Algibacter lectus]